MTSEPIFDDDNGWTHVPGIVTRSKATELADRCVDVLESLEHARVGDKPWSGTRRLIDLDERLPEVKGLVNQPLLVEAVRSVWPHGLDRPDVTFRSPSPGFGQQKLHADDVPLIDCKETRGLTAVVPLVDFTATNGATRLIPGSHRRPDLQRLSGNLDDHPDAIVLTGQAGGAFVFSRHLLHSGTTNRSKDPRPAIQICWVFPARPDS